MELQSCNPTVGRIQLVEADTKRQGGFPKEQNNDLVKIRKFSVHPVLWQCQHLRRLGLHSLKRLLWGHLVRPWQK